MEDQRRRGRSTISIAWLAKIGNSRGTGVSRAIKYACEATSGNLDGNFRRLRAVMDAVNGERGSVTKR